MNITHTSGAMHVRLPACPVIFQRKFRPAVLTLAPYTFAAAALEVLEANLPEFDTALVLLRMRRRLRSPVRRRALFMMPRTRLFCFWAGSGFGRTIRSGFASVSNTIASKDAALHSCMKHMHLQLEQNNRTSPTKQARSASPTHQESHKSNRTL